MDQSNQNNSSTIVEGDVTASPESGIGVAESEEIKKVQNNGDAEVNIKTEIEEEVSEKKDVEPPINNLLENNGTKEDAIEKQTADEEELDSSVKDTIDAKEEVSGEEVATEEFVGQIVVDQAKSVEENIEPSDNEVNEQNVLEMEQNGTNTEKLVEQRSGVVIDPEIMAQLEKYLDNNGITNYNINVESGSNVGDNMLGVIAKVTINGLDRTGSSTELKWIVKIAPENEMIRKMVNMYALYKNEAMIYEAVFPIFKELDNEKSIVHGFDAYPQLLFSYMVPLKETIVMQDMKALGYVLRNKKEPLNLDHVKLVMKTYGKFHALSYAFKYSNPDLFKSLAAKLASNFENAIDVNLLKQSQQIIMDNAKSFLDPVRDSLALKKYSKYVDNFMEIYMNACMTANEYSVICHGDSWINNMLFKYDNPASPDVPTNVCLLDFQVARFSSPASDISYFLFTCTNKALRDEHYDNMIQLYYYTLCAYLNDLGFDPEKCLSFDALQSEIKRYSIIGFYMSLLALIAMTRDADEIPDWQNTKDEDMQQKLATKSRNEEDYNERIRNIIIEYTQRGYFDFLF